MHIFIVTISVVNEPSSMHDNLLAMAKQKQSFLTNKTHLTANLYGYAHALTFKKHTEGHALGMVCVKLKVLICALYFLECSGSS